MNIQGNFLVIKALTFVTFINGKKIISARDHKISNLQTKIISRKVNSTLSDCDVIANLKELHSNFVVVQIDIAANNVGIICKKLHALVIMKELEFSSGNSDDKNCTFNKNIQLWKMTINEHEDIYLITMLLSLTAKWRHQH